MVLSAAVIFVSLFVASSVLALGNRPEFLVRPEQSSSGAPEVVYTNNWAGALWDKRNGTFDTITGTFFVPVLSGPNGSGASAWVGIDGDTCKSAIFRAGVDFTVDGNRTSYEAWYKWYPNPQFPFSKISISSGDIIRVSVTADSTTSGTALVENLTSRQREKQYVQSISVLCGQNAEWVAEIFGESGNSATFANFGTVTFKDAVATGPTGIYKPNGATILDIMQNNQTMTSVSVKGSSLTINYV